MSGPRGLARPLERRDERDRLPDGLREADAPTEAGRRQGEKGGESCEPAGDTVAAGGAGGSRRAGGSAGRRRGRCRRDVIRRRGIGVALDGRGARRHGDDRIGDGCRLRLRPRDGSVGGRERRGGEVEETRKNCRNARGTARGDAGRLGPRDRRRNKNRWSRHDRWAFRDLGRDHDGPRARWRYGRPAAATGRLGGSSPTIPRRG